jgi:hypothetical protein
MSSDQRDANPMKAQEARLSQAIADALASNCAAYGLDAAALNAATIVGTALQFILQNEGPRSALRMVKDAKDALEMMRVN